ncbi:dihydrofolate reductase [Actinomyces howellii]|uniref:dihydrofolate reductase n=1 Tax=Actinomyces howellii TaxID=52771 RepID=A0A3S5EH83_9ACTO|nr:dihydrofolate reductase [Actinomyces howellii]VEG30105.1 Dihydrofolate reductase type 3 [Actinomyces howellii]
MSSVRAVEGAGTSPSRPERLGMIWAQDHDRVLGAQGEMLWRVPADFRHFKDSTTGCGLVMGRTTWESLGGALPGRASVVLTTRPRWCAPGAVVARSLEEAVARARTELAALGPDPRTEGYRDLPRLWVIGGGSVYHEALKAGIVDLLVVSTLDLDAAGPALRRGVEPEELVLAPPIDPRTWRIDPRRSDAPEAWRPVSGDAAWRVDHWVRREAPDGSGQATRP